MPPLILRPTAQNIINFGSNKSTRIGSRPVSAAAGGSGSFPNKPANFVNTREINFSQGVPSGTIGSQRSIVGSDQWYMIYDADYSGSSSATKVTDATAPMSPSDVWKMQWVAGDFWPDPDGGHGIGNIFTNITSENVAHLYTSVHFKFSAGYPWHNISNKWLWWTPNQLLQQSNEGGVWMRGAVLDAVGGGQWLSPGLENGATLNTYSNTAITDGVWHQIESLIDRSTGTWKTWYDGTLTLDASGVTFDDPYFQEFLLEAFRGGGGETLPSDCENYWDHIHLAWA
jgi:hypothetical protein